jgi:DNA transposition AAA+ family ATPase
MHTPEQIEQLRALARDVRNYQESRDWSDAKVCKTIPSIGSTKTYKRILDPKDDLDELSIENQLAAYESAVENIKIRRDKDLPAEIEYDDFSNIVESRAAVARAMIEESVARLVIIEGPTATGKDAVRKNLEKQWGKTAISVEANEFWTDTQRTRARGVPILDILTAMGFRRSGAASGDELAIPFAPSERLALLLSEGAKRKRLLLVNEAHHMGPSAINLTKTIINRTDWVVVWLCIPKLLNDVLKANFEEAIQMTGNRLNTRVRLQTPPSEEVSMLFERRGIRFANKDTEARVSRAVSDESKMFGNWRFVIQFTRLARERCSDPLTMEDASKLLISARSRRLTTESVK